MNLVKAIENYEWALETKEQSQEIIDRTKGALNIAKHTGEYQEFVSIGKENSILLRSAHEELLEGKRFQTYKGIEHHLGEKGKEITKWCARNEIYVPDELDHKIDVMRFRNNILVLNKAHTASDIAYIGIYCLTTAIASYLTIKVTQNNVSEAIPYLYFLTTLNSIVPLLPIITSEINPHLELANKIEDRVNTVEGFFDAYIQNEKNNKQY